MCCSLGAEQAGCEPAGLAERAVEATSPASGEEVHWKVVFLAVVLQQKQ